MATNFDTSLDSFATLVDNTDAIVAAHPNDRGDAIEAIEAKVGVASSAVSTSHDYLLTHLPAQGQNWDAGSYEIRAQTLESDVATGTAPLTIASTTMCTNLNADLLDGAHKPTGDIIGTSDTQTLTNKTLTSPDINGGTWNGTIDGNWTAAGQTCANLGIVSASGAITIGGKLTGGANEIEGSLFDIDGGAIDGVTIGAAAAPTVTNLGTVTTCDINGGSIDGVTIGAAAAPTVTNLGSVTTCDINGGTIDGVTIGASSAPTVTNLGTVTTCNIDGGTMDDVQVDGATATGMLFTNDANDKMSQLGSQGTAGQFLQSAGTGVNPTWASVSNKQFFTGNGTFTAPAGVTTVLVTVVGGGGGGGGGYSVAGTDRSGGGGGGGGTIIDYAYTVTPSSNYTVVVGAAGTAGAVHVNGGNGGQSSFDSVLIVNGGGGGGGASIGSAGAAGAGGATSLVVAGRPTAGLYLDSIAGQAGSIGSTTDDNAIGGGGGASAKGNGGTGGSPSTQTAPTAGAGYGGGGGGGYGGTYSPVYESAGAAGKAGLVIVEW